MDKHERRRAFAERLKSKLAQISLPVPLAPGLGAHVVEVMCGKAPLVWIQGQNCTGCTCALLDSDQFDPTDLGYGKVSLRYQPDLMGGTGAVATGLLDDVWEERPGRYILVVEGAIPTGEYARFCSFGTGQGRKSLFGHDVADEKPMEKWLEELIPDAAAVVAVGNCASFGGIPKTIAETIGARPVPEIVREIDSRKPVINITGCPPHPDWLVGTLEDALLWIVGEAAAPELDDLGRVKEFYEKTVHELCERLPAFKEKRFLEDWNDVCQDEDRCLLKLGCAGPKTHADCPTRLWNSRFKWCVAGNAPCHGCADPEFIDKMRHPVDKKKKEPE